MTVVRWSVCLMLAGVLAHSRADAASQRMECARLVPAAIVARYVPGATVRESGAGERTVLCDAMVGNRYGAQASYLCRPTDTLASFLEKKTKARKRPAVGGLGRSAYGDGRNVAFWDDDTECGVEVIDHLGQNAVALAKELAAALRPDVLPALPAGKLVLACEKLLPQPLRAKWAKGASLEAEYSQADQMNCTLAAPGKMPITLSYTCRGAPPDARYWSEYRKNLRGASEDVSVWTGGVYWATSGAHTVNFADGETGCLVGLMTFTGDKPGAVALARDVEKALTAESAR